MVCGTSVQKSAVKGPFGLSKVPFLKVWAVGSAGLLCHLTKGVRVQNARLGSAVLDPALT